MESTRSSTAGTADIAAVRDDFPIFQQRLPKGLPVVFLDSASSAQKPQAIIDKEREAYEQYYANAYRGVYRFGARVDEELEACREKTRALIGAEATDEIIFTCGSTMALNVVAGGWAGTRLQPEDEILINEMEHHANLVPWQQVARRTGARLRYLPLTDDGRLDLAQLDQHLHSRTRLVALCGMSNVLGTLNPVRTIAERAHEQGAIVVVDGAQSVPHLPTDVVADGIDFLCFSGHKLYGPSGVGVLYGRRALLEEMEPFVFGGHMIERVERERSTWAAPPAKFEAGTLPLAQAIGLGAAIDYVDRIGFDAIGAHERELTRYLYEQLSSVPGIRIYGPGLEDRGGIVSFTIDRAHAEDLAQMLDRRGVFVRHGHHCTMPLHAKLGVPATVRASLGIYNGRADVDALVDGLGFALDKLRLR